MFVIISCGQEDELVRVKFFLQVILAGFNAGAFSKKRLWSFLLAPSISNHIFQSSKQLSSLSYCRSRVLGEHPCCLTLMGVNFVYRLNLYPFTLNLTLLPSPATDLSKRERSLTKISVLWSLKVERIYGKEADKVISVTEGRWYSGALSHPVCLRRVVLLIVMSLVTDAIASQLL